MSKRRSGLQKDFDEIFDGVWIPKKPRAAKPSDQSSECDTTNDTTDAEPARDQPSRLPDEVLEQIQAIAGQMQCPKDFACVQSGFASQCKARLIGNGEMLECLADDGGACRFRVTFAGKSFCKCQLRFFIAKKLGK